MWPFPKTEYEKWATPRALARTRYRLGLTALDGRSRDLYGRALPRGVLTPRLGGDRAPFNYWMPPEDVAAMSWLPGQLILGQIGGQKVGYIDDRPVTTLAGARAGKSSTVLIPNLYLYPGSMLVPDPKGELAAETALIRHALGHNVVVLDPFGQTGLRTASFNALDEIDPASMNAVDDAAAIAQAVIVQGSDAKSDHWNDAAQALCKGVTLLALTLPREMGRDLVTVRQLLTLTHPSLVKAVRSRPQAQNGSFNEDYFEENKAAVSVLCKAMAETQTIHPFGEILAGIGRRFLSTPPGELGSIFSTAAAQTDFLDSLPLRAMSRRSDFRLSDLRSDRPTTIYLCLPVGRMESHYRWLRLVVQLACTVLEQMGPYPRDRTPILFMMEEFATLRHMEIMERAAAYFPGFGVKLWAVLQDVTQLRRYYSQSWETFLGNSGLVQCFANSDEATLAYIADRLGKLIQPFELRRAFSRERHSQLLMFEGQPPAAVSRLEHDDVSEIRAAAIAAAWDRYNGAQ